MNLPKNSAALKNELKEMEKIKRKDTEEISHNNS